ncbi:hybrid non-ribosomal peptide synthetase/type I polyketide synthase [Streptomyces sp. NRRL WC-3742]|uniref:non-ribosomal peptide synthetase/type I polyketide synthase n=1 Tax=Streptomyces sp. NRRL WC-3742 TaxID=1463934 RepID=UPI0004C86692|nr:hybrid non-ribosomal peptide synthetase/type I polyketide synthase [Streptomyces sp. NRRL WC-3742]
MTTSPFAVPCERIAITGIGCRLPGHANDHRTYWRNLIEGRDCLTDTPADRYNTATLGSRDRAKPGRLIGGRGGYIDGFDTFDPDFFGISPREAAHMDPQQRKLLEVSWEALEDGGMRPGELAGREVGVYMGAFTLDWKILQFADLDFRTIAAHTATGTMMTMVSNRISHCFDFRGPSLSIDTACSSSLVAVHLACQSLLRGESELALAGGALLHMTPQYTIAETKGGFLSADGRSRAFDASANGYVRAEGVGVVVLKRLSDALRDGDQVHAVVLGTGVNQDGRTNGITVPSADAQVALIEKVCAEAGIEPGSLQYVEAHGTSTPVGDPIEAAALGRVLGRGRRAGERCYVGSVKTNIGHTEAAAGVAGLIKTALALKHRRIPPHLNLERPNPGIDLDALPFDIPTAALDWPEHTGPARAGVNSFGFGGTNAHVLLEEPPSPALLNPAVGRPVCTVLPLSTKDAAALPELAGAVRRELAEGAPLADLGHTLAHRRQHLPERLAVAYRDREELEQALAACERGEAHPALVQGRARERRQRRLAWVFTGMGPQWWGMGRGLYDSEPVYREALEAVDREVRDQAGWSLLEEMLREEADSRMAHTWLAQPANFALQVGLSALWRSRGVRPDAVVGHSTGEVAAFHEAGVYDLPDAVRVVLTRSRLQQRLAGTGAMIAAGLSEAEAERRLRPYRELVSLAAVNGPSSVTLAGDTGAIGELAGQLAAEGVFVRALEVKVPYHSLLMDPIREELLAGLAGIKPRRARLPLHLTGREGVAAGPELDGAYWWDNVRDTVRFRAAVERMAAEGLGVFLEIGPHPVLGHAVRESVEHAVCLPSLRRHEDEPARLTRSLAELHTLGVELDWTALHPAGRPVPLPGYPWRRERYWTEPEAVRQVRLGEVDHPLLGRRTASAQPTWATDLDPERLPYLGDHRIEGQAVLPAAGYLEMAAQAVRALTGGSEVTLADVEFQRALVLSESEPTPVQLGYAPEDARFTIASTPGGESLVHATGRVRTGQRRAHGPALDAESVRLGKARLDGPDCYRRLADHGYHYGPAFRNIAEVWAGPGEALARIEPAAALGPRAGEHHLHPALLDACFQTLLTTRLHAPERGGVRGGVRLPVAIGELRIDAVGARPLWAHATVTRDSGEELVGDLALYAEDGTPLGRITGFRAADVTAAATSVGLATIDGWLTEPVWTEVASPSATEDTGDLLIFADEGGLAERLAALTGRAHLVRPGANYSFGERSSTVRPDSAEDHARLLADLGPAHRTAVHLWNLDQPALDSTTPERLDELATHGAYALIALAQALPAARPQMRLHIVTRGAQAAGPEDRVEPLGAPAWGLGRVLWQQELVAQRGTLIDLDPARPAAEQAETLLAELAARDEQEIALRGGRRLTARLRPAEGLTRPLPPVLRADGSYLVTGAFGALGRLLCRTLVRRGARRLILVGRTALPGRDQWAQTDPATPAGERIAFLRELQALGASPLIAPVDVTDGAALAAWLDDYRSRELPPVRGVFHLAGQVRDTLLAQMDRPAFDAGYAPKVIGAHLLHRLLREEPLDHFVLFASVASLLTTAGQTNYAAGNAFLDALAHHRRAAGLPGLSLDWGPWATGMIEELGLVAHYRDARGMNSLPPEAGTAVLERVLGQDRAQLLIAPVVDWPTFLAWYPAPPPLVADLAAAAADRAPAEAGGFLDAYRPADPDARRALVLERLTAAAAAVLRTGADRIEETTRLGAHGLDSLLAMELRARVHGELGVALPVVALLGNGTVGDLADLLTEGLTALLATLIEEAGPGRAEAELHTDEARFPLTHNQQALWFLRQLHPDGFAYNIGGAVEVRAELDPELLFAAFRHLVERHPLLRAAFTTEQGRPVQHVRAEPAADTALFDVEGRPWEEVRELLVGEYRRPYDLERDPLVRLRLFRRGPDRWVLMKAVHHIVSDAISTFTFIEELFEVYAALREGRTPQLPPVAARYLDFLNHQNRFLAGPEAGRMLGYWRGHLPAEMPVLALPTDRPRPAVQTHNGASEFFRLDAELTDRVHALAREHNATPFMVLLSAYYLLLHRWSGQDGIVVGSPVTGRTQEEFASVYGYFVNPLPLHVSLAGEPTVAELLARVRESVLGGLDHQEYPFPLLVEQLGLQHDPSRSAVFQAMFILLTHKVAVERFGYRLEYIELPEEEGQFDLTLSAYEDRADGSFHCVFKYNSDLFDPGTVQRLAAHYRNLLDAMTRAGADEPVGRLRMLDTAERRLILEEFSGAARRIDHDAPLPELFAKAAAEHPEALAVVHPGRDGVERLTYGELDRRSHRRALRLRELGVGEGAVVAVHLDKSPELITTLLAVWRAGAAYLPLDPGHPADRLAHQIADARAALVLVDQRRPLPEGLIATPATAVAPATAAPPAMPVTPVTPVTLEELDRPARAEGPLPAPDPDRTAYVIHTSGSTGRPKGVRVTHRNLSAVTAGWRAEYRLDTEARVHLQMAASAFDVFTGDLARALGTGGALVLVDRDLLFDTARLHRVMREEAVDCGEFVPAVARALLAHCERDGLRLDFLKLLIVGSDSWKASEHRRLRALCGPHTRLVNSYGLTEATVDSSYYEGAAEESEPGRMVPIGRPFPNSELYILDRHGEPVPVGVPGELWIGGAGVAAGYLGDPEQTARRFATVHLDGTPRRLYRTGDLGHWSADGTAHLLGRIDNQVKVRGHRIEPGEIEAHLTALPDVAHACVTVRQDHSGDAALAAYLVPAEGAALDRRELRRRLAEHLPTVMIPSYLTELPALPLTANGKVDLAALPAPETDTGGDHHEPPVTLYEQRVADHWQRLLGLDRAGLQHDFFELGGSSIRLIELIHHLQAEFTIEIPVGLLFKVTTLHGMARTVEQIVTGELAGAQPYLWFNSGAPGARTLFCFPPAGGHGLVYRQLAAHLPEHRVAAFNYLSGDDKTSRYADLVETLHPEGPYTLLGYSLGGNLAFEVARELEARGRTVTSVLLLDAYRVNAAFDLGEDHLAAFERELHEHLHRHTGSRIVARESLHQARDYLEFCSRTPNLGTVRARLDVLCEPARLAVHTGGEEGSWQGASTGGTTVRAGHGSHAEMLDGESAALNAAAVATLLTGGTADGRG